VVTRVVTVETGVAADTVRSVVRQALALCVTLLAAGTARADGLLDGLVQRFAASDFEFDRARSNAPQVPVAWLSTAYYDTGRFVNPGGATPEIEFGQKNLSEAAFLPLPLGRRDAVLIGEWVSRTNFQLRNSAARNLDVLSVALPIGWLRQWNADWQSGTFIAPLGATTSRDDGWYWEMLGGAFARRAVGDRTAWIFGVYYDVGPLEDFYTPYLGATFLLDERWAISAVLPWPGVVYAPDASNLFRLGVSPSGASWSVEPGVQKPRMQFSAWNLGISAEHRLYGMLWLSLEAGVSGIRALSIVGGELQAPAAKLENSGYAALSLKLRPDAPH
jgi:hypothetical protein